VLLQRYFEKSFSQGTAVNSSTGVAGASSWSIPAVNTSGVRFGGEKFSVVKRVPPTITFYNPAAANANMRDYIGNLDITGAGPENIGDSGFTVGGNTPSGTFVGRPAAVHWTASARM